MRPGLSVVIPNYNGMSVLGDGIDSVFAATASWPEGAVELIVSDDRSRDGSPEWVESRWPRVRVLRNERNLGFAGNCNRGIAAAAHAWVFLMNSDMRVRQDTFERLLAARDAHAGLPAFALQPRVMYPDERGLNCGRTALRLMRGRTEKWRPESDGRVQPTLYAMGGAMLFEKAKFAALGGFDEAFSPYYGEDLDLCFRAWRRGWPSLYVPDAEAVHLEGQTIGKDLPARIRLAYERNFRLVEWRNLDDPRHAMALAFWTPLRFLSHVLRGNLVAARAMLQLLARWHDVVRGRRIEAGRRFTSREVLALSAADALPRDLSRPSGRCG